KHGDQQYGILPRLDEQFRNDPGRMGNLLIPSSTPRPVKLSEVAQLSLEHAPASIQRYNRQRQITINAGLDGIPLGDPVALVREKVAELNLKPGYNLVFSGGARQLSDASNDFGIAVLLAIIFIY